MSFVDLFNSGHKGPAVRKLERLLQPDVDLESLAAEAMQLTRQHFGRTMRLFAPLYVSNECVNICKYCGFSRDNPILRVTLKLDEVQREARHLVDEGFRNILIVAGEHPKFVSEDYLVQVIERLQPIVPALSIEVGPMETPEYQPIVKAGCEGLIVYQETYDREAYAELHVAGPKKDFDWRLECPERGYDAGFRRIGIGALMGLSDWRQEAVHLAMHTDYLLKNCWKSFVTLSFPRLRPAAGEFEPRVNLSDREFTQMLCAFRVCFPHIGLVMSTREPRHLRDGLAPLGVTMMSAGSHTEPGGYTSAGKEDLHVTNKGRRVDVEVEEDSLAEEQFHISDERSAAEVAQRLRELGLDPVWKDWDAGILDSNAGSLDHAGLGEKVLDSHV